MSVLRPGKSLCVASSIYALALLGIYRAEALPLQAAITQSLQVDLELVLAVDTSLSMKEPELKLQRDGYVSAFRHADLWDAITSGPLRRIGVTYVEWGGPRSQRVVIPWTVISSPSEARQFADRLSSEILVRSDKWKGGTAMGDALLFARSLFGDGGLRGARQVIDISGDGPNNSGRPLDRVRDEVLADGITINGLPIHLEHAASGGNTRSRQASLLETYYRDCVIGGPSAFVVSIEDESQIDAATRRKLLQEIIAAAPAVLRASAVDRDMSSITCSGPEWPPGR